MRVIAKKAAALLLCALLCLPMTGFAFGDTAADGHMWEDLPAEPNVFDWQNIPAAETDAQPEAAALSEPVSVVRVGLNRFTGGVEAVFVGTMSNNSSVVAKDVFESVDDAAVFVRQNLAARSTGMRFEIFDDNKVDTPEEVEAFAKLLAEKAYEHTCNPKEGDSLKYQMADELTFLVAKKNAGLKSVTVCGGTEDDPIVYLTTAAQEAELDAAVAKLIAEIKPDGKRICEKVEAVYSWIAANVTAGQGLTAHSALVSKSAASEGVALLVYRAMLELGIDARVVTGTVAGEPRAWNVVRVGSYYNVDAYEDLGAKEFTSLLCGSGYSDFDAKHARADEFRDPEFLKDYPVPAEGYDPENPLRGDLNVDGIVSVADGVVMQRVLAELEDDPDAIFGAKLTDDADINISDGVVMQRILAGLEK